jgi:uncharacterized membrane protein
MAVRWECRWALAVETPGRPSAILERAQALPTAILGAAAAFLVVAGAGLLAHGVVQRIPRSALQLLVGTLLTRVGWPASDAAILVLAGWYALAAAGYVGLLRRRAHRLLPQEVSR